MINILILADALRYTCGATYHILNLSRGLSLEKNIKLFLIAGGGNGADRFKDINAGIKIDKNFLHGKRNYYSYLQAIITLKYFIKKNKINIVHSHSHYAANIARQAVKNPNITTIQTNHGLLKIVGRLKHFNADKYVAVNEHVIEHLIQNKIADKKNIFFIRSGIPIPNISNPKTQGPLKFVASSRFVKEKGLDIFIESVSKLKNRNENVEFMIAGEGELEYLLKKQNEDYKTDIKFLGRVEDMNNLFSSTHVFVFPSVSDSEGFPAVIVEAGANKNLIVSSNFIGANPVLENNVNSLIYNKHSSDNLAELLENIRYNYKKYIPIADQFHKKVKEEFNIETMIEKHLELYYQCLQK